MRYDDLYRFRPWQTDDGFQGLQEAAGALDLINLVGSDAHADALASADTIEFSIPSMKAERLRRFGMKIIQAFRHVGGADCGIPVLYEHNPE